MARNIEIKARVSDPDVLRERARNLVGADPEILIQRDTFYHSPQGRLKLREIDGKAAELIYYQRPDQPGPKQSEYTVTPVSDPASMHELLERALGKKAVVAKRRELFLAGQTRIHLDTVGGLGCFLELEVVLSDSDTAEAGARIARDLMTRLGIRDEDLLEQAYVDLQPR